MKRFLYKIILFFAIVLALGGLGFGTVYLISNYYVSSLKIDKNIHTLICGDSHTQTALNDKLIPNSLNIAHSTEHYLYTYNVLKLLLRNNPQIQNVVLGFSYHNISSSRDKFIFAPEMTQYMYPRYISVLGRKSFSQLITSNPSGFFNNFKDIVRGFNRHIGARELYHFGFIGGYYYSEVANKNDSTINHTIKMHYFDENGEEHGYSDLQTEYLQSIVDLCWEENVELVLLNCPISKEYKAMIPESFIETYLSQTKQYGTIVLDYSDFSVPENCYGDGDHLNTFGAEIFTQHLLEELECLHKP